MATPCSLTPCSTPHSHVGREPTNAEAPGSGSSRYCVRTVPPAGRAGNHSTTCGSSGGRSEFLPNSAPRPPTTASVSQHTATSSGSAGRGARREVGQLGRVRVDAERRTRGPLHQLVPPARPARREELRTEERTRVGSTHDPAEALEQG